MVLLSPDSLRLADKAREAGVPVDLHIGDDPPHACAVFIDTPEGKNALATIVGAARGPTPQAPAAERSEAFIRGVGAALHC